MLRRLKRAQRPHPPPRIHAHLFSDPYEIEKRQVGELWARASAGRALFGWLTMEQQGKGLAQQLDAVLA